VDGGRWSIICSRRTVGVAGQREGYAKSSVVKTGNTTSPIAG